MPGPPAAGGAFVRGASGSAASEASSSAARSVLLVTEARDPERGLDVDKVALLGPAEARLVPAGADPEADGRQLTPLDVRLEVLVALGGIVFPRVQADGSMENSYAPPGWSQRAPRRRKERTGLRYCCWRRPLRDGEVRVWATRFRADMVANLAYLGFALGLWIIAEQGGVWKWWTLLVGLLLGAVVVFKNVIGFYQEIAPLVDDDNLLDLISENVDGVKRRIHEAVYYKLGQSLVVRDELYMEGWKAKDKAARELYKEAELEEFVSGVLLQAVDKAAADVTSRPQLSRLAPWICQAQPRFLTVCATALVLPVLAKSVVDFINWPGASNGLTLSGFTIGVNPFDGLSGGSYTCWSNVCTEDGKRGYCDGRVYYARKFADDDGEAYAKLSDVMAEKQGPFAYQDRTGDYLCHASHHFPPVDYPMHCICDHRPSSRRLAEAGPSDVTAVGFQVILGNIAINAVVAALAGWPVVRWFSNFTLAHTEHQFWRQMDQGVRQSMDFDLFQRMLDKEFKSEMETVTLPPQFASTAHDDDGCSTM